MKNIVILISLLFFTTTFWCFGQVEKEYELKASKNPTLIQKEGFSVSIFEVLENRYNEIGKASGSQFVEIKGYRLSEGLKVLGNYANQAVRIANLKINPYIKWKINISDLKELPKFSDQIFLELAQFYNFTVSKEQAKNTLYELKVINKDELEKHKVKKIKKGVLGESSLQKSGGWIISHSTIGNLIHWLESSFFLNFKTKHLDDYGFYDFYFRSDDLEDIISELKIKYGIELKIKVVQGNVLIIE
jgi:hypothetical protein